MPATTATDCAPLQQRCALPRRRRPGGFVSAAIRLEDFAVLLKLLPSDVAGMGIRDAGEPVIALTLPEHLSPIGGSPVRPPAIDVGACITWIVQSPDRGRYGQRLENRLLLITVAGWKTKSLAPERLDRLAGGPNPRERLEKVGDRLPDMRVGIERHVAGLIVCKSGWQRTAILAAAHLVQDPSPQPGFDDMKFGLAHCSLEAKQKPVVEAGWIVDAVFIEDQRIGESADLQQAMPVGIVPRQAGHFQPHDDADASHAGIAHQALKSLAPRGRGAGLALIAVDNDDLVVAPAKRDRPAAKSILALRAFDILEDLPHRGLPDIEISAPFEVMGLNFEQFVHAALRTLIVIAMAAST